MDGRAFGAAYVSLDRLALHRLRESGQLAGFLTTVKRQIQAASADLKALCDAGCDREEILWLLAGCYSGPAFAPITKLLGRGDRALRSALQSIRNCADLIANLNQQPFGAFAHGMASSFSILQLPHTLNEYASLIQDATVAFGHGSYWYLHLAKARLVDYVTSVTGGVHDRQVSSLIDAMVHPKGGYSESDQAKWRSRYYEDFRGLDPALTWPAERRRQVAQELEAAAAEIPEIKTATDRMLEAYVRLLAPHAFPSQKTAKKRK
jgi:hypothetical protein